MLIWIFDKNNEITNNENDKLDKKCIYYTHLIQSC